MNIKLKAQAVAVSVLATALVGCFEPNGKNFEGAWVNSKKNDVVKPTLLDITCEKGFCEVSKQSGSSPRQVMRIHRFRMRSWRMIICLCGMVFRVAPKWKVEN